MDATLTPPPVHTTAAGTIRHLTAGATKGRGILATKVDTIGIQEQTTAMEGTSESVSQEEIPPDSNPPKDLLKSCSVSWSVK